MHFQLYYRYRTGYRIFLINVSEDFCDYVNARSFKSKIISFLVPVISTYSNQVLACPFSTPYVIDKMPIDASAFENPFLPVGKYYFNLTETTHDVWIWSGQFHFTIPEGKTIEYDGMGR